ncbi:50S ribosomal protein L19 [Candidatus Uhrbacteria bacterium]|nr:50S ribosomal protein L19 [Candidatus Uhrbacteria bacterium]
MYENIKPGMTVRVHEKIKELAVKKGEKGEKERVQIFEGMVISRHAGKQTQATITVRKIGADAVGVEKIYPLNAPAIVKIEPLRQAEVNRAKLYFLKGYKKKLKEHPIAA